MEVVDRFSSLRRVCHRPFCVGGAGNWNPAGPLSFELAQRGVNGVHFDVHAE